MTVTSEMAALHRAMGELRQRVGELRSRYGDVPPVRRLVNDVERLDIDVADLGGLPTAPAPRTEGKGPEIVHVPDTPYDPKLWHDADDEGVGGYHRE
ncbi:hypothetical protein [Streptoalloteichus hindustanus]|uniref:Uncharacterized protein n=1 Tax=Streptoalloteichus hindustanus TaxID=2017 RepID=A0A1M5B9S0_STRHI|nr:hypothetical protein [Streptoalloteichus hindustanus]SHF39175.1 hypothetical protein SAMN05444320_103466 [Streptoalloteichus hindustanus]